MKPFYIIATIFGLILLGVIAINTYISAASSIQIANAVNDIADAPQ